MYLSLPVHHRQVAFEAFSCFVFENGEGFLVTDVAIQCYTPAHEQAKAVASLAIALYPVGLLVLNALLLFRTRHAIMHGTPTKLSEAIRFLHRDYKPQVGGSYGARHATLLEYSQPLHACPVLPGSTFGGSSWRWDGVCSSLASSSYGRFHRGTSCRWPLPT